MRTYASRHGEPVAAGEAVPTPGAFTDVSMEIPGTRTDDLAMAARLLPPGADVFVPLPPRRSFEDVLALATAVRDHGLRPIPHVAARRIESRDALVRLFASFRARGIDGVLLIAGDADRPAGPFADTLAVLRSGVLDNAGLFDIAFAGHPEGHTFADEALLGRALDEKCAFAERTGAKMRLVTQFVFDAAPLIAWDVMLRARGLRIPVRCGLPGPATLPTIVRFGLQCGVGTSARALARRPETARLAGGWSPDRIAERLVAHRREVPDTLLSALHLFAFGGVARTLDWFADTPFVALPGRTNSATPVAGAGSGAAAGAGAREGGG